MLSNLRRALQEAAYRRQNAEWWMKQHQSGAVVIAGPTRDQAADELKKSLAAEEAAYGAYQRAGGR